MIQSKLPTIQSNTPFQTTVEELVSTSWLMFFLAQNCLQLAGAGAETSILDALLEKEFEHTRELAATLEKLTAQAMERALW